MAKIKKKSTATVMNINQYQASFLELLGDDFIFVA